MKDTRMPPAYSANLVANSGNSIYGVSVMGAQLSLKAAMPLAEILATCRKNVSNTGPKWTRRT